MLCNPGINDIAKRAGITDRYASKAVRQLETLDFLRVIRESGKGNRYIINVEKLLKLSTTPEQSTGEKVIHTPELRGETPEQRCKNPRTQFTQTEEQKRTKRARARKHHGTGSGVNPGQWNDNASFRPYTPAAMPKADRKTASGELRSIKSILGARA